MTINCTAPVPTEAGPVPCRRADCDPCAKRLRRSRIGRIGAQSFTAKHTLFWTGTYDNGHLPENVSLPDQHLKYYFKQLRKKAGRLFHQSVIESGSQTGRLHCHAIIMFQDKLPDGLVLNFDTKDGIWPYGNCKYEKPRSTSATIAYMLDYLEKKNKGEYRYGRVLRWSNGMGKQYLGRYAREMGRNNRLLVTPYGIRYTVPNMRKRDGTLWEYFLPTWHPYAGYMAGEYCDAFEEKFQRPANYEQFRSVEFDWV